MNNTLFAYLRLLAALAATVLLGNVAPEITKLLEHSHEAETLIGFFSVSLLFALSFGIFYLSQGTKLPNFVIAIFFGMAAKPLLAPILNHETTLAALVGFGATLILFGGGLETPFEGFKRLLGKILSLSFLGLLITAVLTSWFIAEASPLFGLPLTITAAVLLGAILASTDPAAIIPVLKRLRFKKGWAKDLIVSESAVTDVAGTLLTVIFLGLAASGALETSVLNAYSQIFSAEAITSLFTQIIFGAVFGFLGFSLLAALTRFKARHNREHEADAAFFLFIPIIIFTLAIAFGGSGYLAAFIAGLLFVMSERLHETERFFNHIIDGFFKPTIFLLLGALVDIPSLIAYAPLGIAAALVFVFIIRPIAVALTLGPFAFFGKERPGWRELLFISFVRETGAIPAVLLVTVASMGLTGMDGLLPVGMWVILITLILEPPLTPVVASWIGVAESIPEDTPAVNGTNESFIVLGTRGHTYRERLPFVSEWAVRHGIPKVVVLLCLEYHHQPELEQSIADEAQKQFDRINEQLEARGKRALNFTLISSAGLLQENIDYIAKEKEERAVAIFVGRKMLDYRLNEIKKLRVPLYFLP